MADRYVIYGRAAAGGMGIVLRAHDRWTGRPVAVKIVRADRGETGQLEREVELLAAVSHDNIIRYLAHGRTSDGVSFLVKEWIDGESLSDRMANEGLTLRQSVRVAIRAAEALTEVHRRGIVHQDIKPANILLDHGNIERLKIIDFGIATRIDGQRRRGRSGTLVGTPGYMAPEQARGEAEIDRRADIFALGCVLYECLTGRPPFGGSSSRAVRHKCLHSQQPPLAHLVPEIPPVLERLVSRMLAKAPADRPADAACALDELLAVGHLPSTVLRRSRTPQPATQIQLAGSRALGHLGGWPALLGG